MSRAAMTLVAFVALASCAAPTSVLDEGCIFNSDCEGSLVCSDHRCRAPCRDDRDCVNGWRCRLAGQASLRACFAPTEGGFCVAQSDCEAPAVCGPTGRCGSQCATSYDCQLRGGAAQCRATRQDATILLCTDNPNYLDADGGVGGP